MCISYRWKPLKFDYNKQLIPIIAFGNGMKGKDSVKIKGHQVGLTGVLFKHLKRRQVEGRLLVPYIDEYITSQVKLKY